MSKSTRKLAVGGGIVAAAMGIGIAFAAWTATGTGSGSAKSLTAVALSTSDASGNTFLNQLYPTGSGDVQVKINNPNPYQVTVTSITGPGAIANGAVGGITSGNATCDASNSVTFTNQSGTSLVVVPPKAGGVDGTATVTLTNAASMSNASVDACQTKTFTIPVTVTGASS